MHTTILVSDVPIVGKQLAGKRNKISAAASQGRPSDVTTAPVIAKWRAACISRNGPCGLGGDRRSASPSCAVARPAVLRSSGGNR
jgi:hypothetical protein